jgi:hypothetical protein
MNLNSSEPASDHTAICQTRSFSRGFYHGFHDHTDKDFAFRILHSAFRTSAPSAPSAVPDCLSAVLSAFLAPVSHSLDNHSPDLALHDFLSTIGSATADACLTRFFSFFSVDNYSVNDNLP